MKKLIVVLLCIAMLMSTAIGVFAAEAENATPKATLNFLDTANRTKYDATQAVWSQNGITVTTEMNYQLNSKGELVALIASSAPNKDAAKYDGQYFRFYQQNKITIQYKGMKSIVFTNNNESSAKKIVDSVPQYPGVTVVRDGVVVTVTFGAPKDVFEIEYATGNINLITMDVIAWQKTDVATAEHPTATITIKDRTLSTKRWAYNMEVTEDDAWNYRFLVYDKNFTGKIDWSDNGVAAIVDKDGKLAHIYINNQYRHFAYGKQVSQKNGKVDGEVVDNGQEFGATGQPKYAEYAWSQLEDGQLLIIFPEGKDTQINSGVMMATALYGKISETWDLEGHYFGEKVTLTGINSGNGPENPSVDKTGDHAFVLLALVAVSMTGLVALISRKRAF